MLAGLMITILGLTNIITGALLITSIQDYHQLEGEIEDLIDEYMKVLDEHRKKVD